MTHGTTGSAAPEGVFHARGGAGSSFWMFQLREMRLRLRVNSLGMIGKCKGSELEKQ